MVHVPHSTAVHSNLHGAVAGIDALEGPGKRRVFVLAIVHRHRLHWQRQQSGVVNEHSVARAAVLHLRHHLGGGDSACVGNEAVEHGAHLSAVDLEVYDPGVERLHEQQHHVAWLGYGGAVAVVGIDRYLLVEKLLSLAALLAGYALA